MHFKIYIPIWWYSNDTALALGLMANAFTFQSGDIQIGYKVKLTNLVKEFTFQSGDIQIMLT